jgi:4'-phosphopantetheinyl transferase
LKSINNHILKDVKLSKNEIHVWQIDIETQLQNLKTYCSYLSNTEEDRASKFRFESHKNNYIIRTGILRLLLANYMTCQPNEIEFKLGKFGKPELENSKQKFNLSHSKNKSLIAISQNKEIGIDIEFIDASIEAKTIATHFFSKDEIKQLYTLNDEKLAQGFFNIWTKKEAFIKAVGTGLTYPLDAFDVSLNTLKKKALIRIKSSTKEAQKWNLFSIKTFNDYAGAIAYKGTEKQIHYYNLTAV